MKSNFRLHADTSEFYVCVCVCKCVYFTHSLSCSLCHYIYVHVFKVNTQFHWISLTYNLVRWHMLLLCRYNTHTQKSQFIFHNTTNASTIWVWKFKFFDDDQIVSIHNIDISMLASGKNSLPNEILIHNKGGTVKNGCLLFFLFIITPLVS